MKKHGKVVLQNHLQQLEIRVLTVEKRENQTTSVLHVLCLLKVMKHAHVISLENCSLLTKNGCQLSLKVLPGQQASSFLVLVLYSAHSTGFANHTSDYTSRFKFLIGQYLNSWHMISKGI